MKNEILFWMAVMPSCKVSLVGLVVEIEIEMPLSRSQMLELMHSRYFQSITMAIQPVQ
jgi:hypothetical protein